jgi:transcriptional regulator with XRE-family HTH domain
MSFHPERRHQLAAGLKAARHKSGLSASQAADLIAIKGLACTRGTLLAWERGTGGTSREPFASDLSVLASVYGCRVMEFFQVQLPLASSETVRTLPVEALPAGA